MNVSGPPISKVFVKSGAQQLIAMHDELELKQSDFKVRRSTSFKGHRGLQSLGHSLKKQDFYRFALGIGRPERKQDVASYVMSALSRSDIELVRHNGSSHPDGLLLDTAWSALIQICSQITSAKAMPMND